MGPPKFPGGAMNMKAYDSDLLEKQLKLAKKKGNEEYAKKIEEELKRRKPSKEVENAGI